MIFSQLGLWDLRITESRQMMCNQVLAVLNDTPKSIAQIATETGLDATDVRQILFDLGQNGLVTWQGPYRFVRIN